MSVLNLKKKAKAVVPPAEKEKKVISVSRMNADIRLIRKPHLSEKAGGLNAINQYVFLVEKSANKKEVAKAVSNRYGVRVEGVNILRQPTKRKRIGNIVGRQSGHKKAVVTLSEGQKLEIA